MHGHRHCRLSHITQEGKWKKTERFQIGDRFIVRLKGGKVGRVMLPWRILRKKHPEMFEKVDVYTQPSGYVDAIIQTWMVEDQSERHPGSVWQRDGFQAAFAKEPRQAMWLSQSLPATISPKMTATLQVTDTDFSRAFKASARRKSEELQHAEKKAASRENRSASAKMGPFEIMTITLAAQEGMEQKNLENNWVLAAFRRNGMLSWRPNLSTGRLERADLQEWRQSFPEGTSRMKESWLENRYNWLNSETSKPLEPDWGMLAAAKTLQDLLEWDYCKQLKDAGEEDLELEFNDLSGGLEQYAQDS